MASDLCCIALGPAGRCPKGCKPIRGPNRPPPPPHTDSPHAQISSQRHKQSVDGNFRSRALACSSGRRGVGLRLLLHHLLRVWVGREVGLRYAAESWRQ